MKIDIYSDTSYSSYRHVNQMLHDFFLRESYNSLFLERFIMNYPNLDNIKRRFLKEGKNRNNEKINSTNVLSIYNAITPFHFLDILNSFFVEKQVKSNLETALTFVPSQSLSYLFNKYENLFYYCVHDSTFQNYSLRNKEYENELLFKSKAVFCDNFTVAERFCKIVKQGKPIDISEFNLEDISNLSEDVENKVFVVPPPVPKEFYHLNNYLPIEYDYVYFGSIHKDIDKEVFKKLACQNFKILCVSYDDLNIEHENITCVGGTTSMAELCKWIAISKKILFPYTNSEFMNTISPAKLYQSLATGKIVETTNTRLSQDYGIPMVLEKENERVFYEVDKYSEEKLMNAILVVMKSKTCYR